MEDEHLYYRRRAEEHRRFAEAALSEEARRRHLQLAEMLAAKAPVTAGDGRAPQA